MFHVRFVINNFQTAYSNRPFTIYSNTTPLRTGLHGTMSLVVGKIISLLYMGQGRILYAFSRFLIREI